MAIAIVKNWTNRIVGHGEEDPEQLLAHPLNYRTHPGTQQQALADVIEDVGYIRSVLVNRTTGHVIDGHLRVQLALRSGVKSIPVEYVELSEAEEVEALATHDPIAAMATSDRDQLDMLMREVQSPSSVVQGMLSDLAKKAGVVPSTNGKSHAARSAGSDGDDEDSDPQAEPETETQAAHGDRWPLAIVLDLQQRRQWERIKATLGAASDKAAFIRLMEAYG